MKNMHCIGKNKLMTAASWTEPKKPVDSGTDVGLFWTLLRRR